MITLFMVLISLVCFALLIYALSKASKNFTPKLRIVEFVTKGGDTRYQAQIKSSLFGFWCVVHKHNIKDWCIEQGQEELKRVIDAAIANEKARVVTTRVVPHDIKE